VHAPDREGARQGGEPQQRRTATARHEVLFGGAVGSRAGALSVQPLTGFIVCLAAAAITTSKPRSRTPSARPIVEHAPRPIVEHARSVPASFVTPLLSARAGSREPSRGGPRAGCVPLYVKHLPHGRP
jgi:hypothetical protein